MFLKQLKQVQKKKKEKKRYLQKMTHIHNSNLLCIITYLKNFDLTLNSFFEISKSTILINKKKIISEKFSDLYLMKIQIYFVVKKSSDLYLMKIQTYILLEKNSRFVFNENTYLF